MIRLATHTDTKAIDEYCSKHNIATPLEGLCFISVDETGINGIINAELRMIVEPMIADNPTVSRRLYDTLLGGLMAQGVQKLYLQPTDEAKAKEAEKLGYVIIDRGIISLRKVLNG